MKPAPPSRKPRAGTPSLTAPDPLPFLGGEGSGGELSNLTNPQLKTQKHMKLTTTPWGHPQQQTQIGEGIIVVATAGHGGIHLSPARWQEFRQHFPTFKPFAGQQWLEEDCDCALAALAFPSAFSCQAVANAVDMVTNYGGSYFDEAKAWLATPAAARVRSIHEQAKAENANKWERGSMGTSGDGWSVCITNTTTKETKWEQFTDYPEKQFYTDAELERATGRETRPAIPETSTLCTQGHGGNRHLTRTLRGFYECDGCATLYTRAQVTTMESDDNDDRHSEQADEYANAMHGQD